MFVQLDQPNFEHLNQPSFKNMNAMITEVLSAFQVEFQVAASLIKDRQLDETMLGELKYFMNKIWQAAVDTGKVTELNAKLCEVNGSFVMLNGFDLVITGDGIDIRPNII